MKKLAKDLFGLFTGQLLGQGIVAKEGSIVDASFLDLLRQHNIREENVDIKKGTYLWGSQMFFMCKS